MGTRALFGALLREDPDAVDLCMTVFDWANCYDHLVDNDVPPEQREATLHRAMFLMTTGLSRNPFWLKHQRELSVTFQNAVTSWKTATALQRRADTHSHIVAHVLRWAPIEFFIHCARIVGGDHWADAVAPTFWLNMTQGHSLEEFLPECGVGGH